jgi:cell division control protein 6
VETQPKQFQIVLYSIMLLNELDKEISTGKVYENYKILCEKIELRPITQRRVSDIISEFDMLGILTVAVVSKGRYGRTRNIMVAINPDLLIKIKNMLELSLGFLRNND